MPATLLICRDAVAHNYASLCREAQGAEVGAVLKADAYGIGLEWAAPLVWEAGARTFFVANIQEGIELKKFIPQAQILIFHGLGGKDPASVRKHGLIPIINTFEDAQKWGSQNPCWIQVDIGMRRLGFSLEELQVLPPLHITGIMAQLSTSEIQESPHNQLQKLRFDEALTALKGIAPQATLSLCNSGGLFLGDSFTHHMVRAGITLWGVGEIPDPEDPATSFLKDTFKKALTLKAPVLQVRTLQESTQIGYHQMGYAEAGEKIVTVEIGYGDGLLRAAKPHTYLTFKGLKLPICGRVSMDAVMVKAPASCQIQALDEVTVWGDGGPSTAQFARLCGTTAYELLCILTRRVERRVI